MEQQEKAIALLDLFATSRTGIDQASDELIRAVQDGKENPLKVLVWCKTVEEVVERVRKETKENQLTAAFNYAEKRFEFAGATIEKAELGTKYDYSTCGDIEWERLDAEVKGLIEKRGIREDFLKSLKGPLTLVNEETGQVYRILPPVKKSTTGLKVTIR